MESRIKALAQAHDLPTDKIEQAEQLLGFDIYAINLDVRKAKQEIENIRMSRDMAKTNALILCITADYALRSEYAKDDPNWDGFMLTFDEGLMRYLHIDKTNATIERIWH